MKTVHITTFQKGDIIKSIDVVSTVDKSNVETGPQHEPSAGSIFIFSHAVVSSMLPFRREKYRVHPCGARPIWIYVHAFDLQRGAPVLLVGGFVEEYCDTSDTVDSFLTDHFRRVA